MIQMAGPTGTGYSKITQETVKIVKTSNRPKTAKNPIQARRQAKNAEKSRKMSPKTPKTA